MKKTLCIIMLSAVFAANCSAAKKYEIPPSKSTSLHTPYISDKAMEECVILYNETKWLGDEISATQVDRYSQSSVNAYNEELSRFNRKTDIFNKDCAGKQSESAYKATLELNKNNAAN